METSEIQPWQAQRPIVKQEPVDWSESLTDCVQLLNKDNTQPQSSTPEFIACAQEEHVVKLEMLPEPDTTEPLAGSAEIDNRIQLEVSDTDNVRYLHLGEVRRLVCSKDPKSYAGGSIATGRVTQAGQVEGEEPDKLSVSNNQSDRDDNSSLHNMLNSEDSTATCEDAVVTSVNKENELLDSNVTYSKSLPLTKSCDEPKLNNNNNSNSDNKSKLKVVSINKLKEFHCPTCEKSFTKLSHLEKHLAKKCDEKVFNCLGKSKRYLCEICSKVLTTRSGLVIHVRGHGERSYSCQICHKKFLLHVQLRDHSRLHSGERPFECAVCHKSYTRKACLKVHVLKHTGEMPFRCDLCHKRFTRKYNLLKHLQSHSGDRPFGCYLCSKHFKSKQNLEVHYRVHTARSVMLHTCNICQENFNTKIRLTRHKIREHSGYRPFTCHVCRKPFIFKSQLTSHVKEHNIQKPFSCSKCNKSYVRQAHLVTHIKAHCSDFVPIPPEVKLEVVH